jgi:hypothetical protein
VWQAGPAGVTWRSTASASQSTAAPTTRWTFPLVAPLCQSSLRDREKNVASPVSKVFSSAARLCHASISTSPVAASWTIAGTRPRSPFA